MPGVQEVPLRQHPARQRRTVGWQLQRGTILLGQRVAVRRAAMTCSHTSCPPGGPCRQTGIPEVTVIPMAPPTFRPGLDEPLSPEIGVGSTGRRIAALEAEGARLR